MRSLKNISFLLFLVGFPLMLFSQSKTYKVFSPASKILVISGHPLKSSVLSGLLQCIRLMLFPLIRIYQRPHFSIL